MSRPQNEEFDLDWLHPDPWVRSIRELVTDMDATVPTVVVEGKRDRQGLERAGYTGTVRQCSDASGIVPFADSLEGTPVAILTDYDGAGRQLNGRLRELLPARRVDPYWRRELGLLLTQRGRYDIEALNNVFDGGRYR